jgi:hypothetical protein
MNLDRTIVIFARNGMSVEGGCGNGKQKKRNDPAQEAFGYALSILPFDRGAVTERSRGSNALETDERSEVRRKGARPPVGDVARRSTPEGSLKPRPGEFSATPLGA